MEEKCLHCHEPPPLYTVLSETGKNNEPYFTVKCEAMGYTAVGKKISNFANSSGRLADWGGENQNSYLTTEAVLRKYEKLFS